MKMKETERKVKEDKKCELKSIRKTIEIQVKLNNGKFEEACFSLNELVKSKCDEKDVVPAVILAIHNSQTCKKKQKMLKMNLQKSVYNVKKKCQKLFMIQY